MKFGLEDGLVLSVVVMLCASFVLAGLYFAGVFPRVHTLYTQAYIGMLVGVGISAVLVMVAWMLGISAFYKALSIAVPGSAASIDPPLALSPELYVGVSMINWVSLGVYVFLSVSGAPSVVWRMMLFLPVFGLFYTLALAVFALLSGSRGVERVLRRRSGKSSFILEGGESRGAKGGYSEEGRGVGEKRSDEEVRS